MSPPLRILFMGSPDFALPSLEALVELYPESLDAVITQPPRVKGRNAPPQKTPVHLRAEALGLPVYTPPKLAPAAPDIFEKHQPTLVIVSAYGHILRPFVLTFPAYGCLNIHASLLPRWRGAAPIEHALLAGDTETGVCLMQMTEGMDEGPVIREAHLPIAPEATALEVRSALATLGGGLLKETLPLWLKGALSPRPQPTEGITYAPKITAAMRQIPWEASAKEVACHVRAFFPKASFLCGEDRYHLLTGCVGDPYKTTASPGTLLDDALTVQCGKGTYRILSLQAPGRCPLEAQAFLNGNRKFQRGINFLLK